MMRILIALAPLAFGLRLDASAANAAQANPIRRIVNLLQKMQKEAQAEGERDEELHTKFMCYCKTGASALQGEINDQSNAATEAQKDSETKFARVAQLKQEVADHKSAREEAKANIQKATEIRKKEHAEFVKASGDLGKNVEALSKAVSVIGKGMGKSFLQSRGNVELIKRAVAAATEASETERQTVLSFLASPYGDYQAASGEIVGILKAMKDEMEKDLGTTMSDEKEAVRSFEELMAAKKAEIAAATKAIEEKSVRSGQLEVEATESKNAAANARKAAGENSEFAANLQKNCETKAGEFEARKKERNQEILAISEAIKILNDDDALEIFKKTLPSPGSAPALIQADTSEIPARVTKAFALVQGMAAVSPKPARLSLLSYMLKVGKVDFSKVLKMIDEMVAHLGEEQKSDDDHLAFCNSELDKEGDNKKDQERKIKDLSASVDELESRIAQLTDEMKVINTDMAETEKQAEEATAQRKQENEEFKRNMVELNAATQLLAKAKNRLMKFYNPALYKPPPQRELTEEERIAQNMGEVIPTQAPEMIAGTNIAVHLMQEQAPIDIGEEPETGAYEKRSSKNSGVTQLMDMLQKDLDSQMQEAEHDEKVAQRDYEKLMADSKQSLADSKAELTQKEGEHAECRSNLDEDKQAREQTNKELMATNEKIGALHGSCDFLIQNFDFRKAARTREVEGLKNAKAVLSGADFS